MNTKENVYMLGIGGISMSALAILLKNDNFNVMGYDSTRSKATKMLENEGVFVEYALNKDHISKCDLVVCSSAIKPGNEILEYAQKCGKKIISRGELLGKISSKYENVIAISGSHGKTTTTALIYEILRFAGKNPTLHLGGFLLDGDTNVVVGEKEFFVTEACEYCDNFLFLYPTISVVTNVEKEHMDYFKTFENQKRSFSQFERQSLCCVKSTPFKAKYLHHKKDGSLSFSVFENDKFLMDLNLKICEEVNTQNCLFALEVARKLSIPDAISKLAIENFKGVATRFQKMNCPYFSDVICDYAHHPTEISKAVISAKKIFKNRNIVTIFQPHTFSRTKTLLPEFLSVFRKIEKPILFQTYSAREKESDGISAKQFVFILKKDNKKALYFDNFQELFDYLMSIREENPVVLVVGAGDLPAILHKNNFLT